MRPVSVAFDCFGPYLDHQEVDFRTLARDGLFLIRGETGAGKTTVLDAICCALYGQSSNGNGKDEGAGRGGLEDMRCRSASPSQETRVSFVFEQDGTQYYFERHIRVTRLGTLSAVEASCGVGTPEKPERVLASKPTAVSQEAEALIGLRVDQFRQVILLPQGKFQKLLVSDPEEKRKIISSLFNTGRLKKAAELFRQEVTDEQHRLESERGQIEAGLRRWECGTCADLAAACAEREAAIAGLRGDEAGQKKRLEAAHEALTLASQTEERFAALDKASQQLSGMLASAAEQERRVRGAELAARAAAAEEAHDALLLAEKDRKETAAALRSAELARARAEETHRAAAAALELHSRGQDAQDERIRRRTLLENLGEAYTRAEELRAAWDAKRRLLPGAEKRERAARDGLARHLLDYTAKKEKADRERAAYEEMNERYIREIAGELGLQLRPGAPCPVCGSTSHPLPARISGDHVSKAELERQRAARDASGEAVRALENRTAALQEAGEAAKAELDALTRDIDEKKAALDAAAALLDPEIPDAAALARAVDALTTQIKAWERETETRRGCAEQARTGLDAARAVAGQHAEADRKAAQALDAARTAWESARLAAGFADDAAWQAAWMPQDELRQLQSAVTAWETRLQAVREAYAAAQDALAGTQRPDMQALRDARRAAGDAHTETISRLSALGQQLESMKADLNVLTERSGRLKDSEEENRRDRAVADALVGLRGKPGLEAYMLSAMLRSVTEEANRLLAGMYGGRFQLEVPGFSSLSLDIIDRDFDVKGPVASLSGGEKFLVALALGIGLANVVATQAQSVNMDALFIDEGFGSLDPKACQDAVAVLHSLRGSRMVGVISHVEILREDIPAQLIAEKTSRGSRLRPM